MGVRGRGPNSALPHPISPEKVFLKLSRSPGNNSKESNPPWWIRFFGIAYVAWRAGTTTLFLLVS
jgi:hypothetical protein